MNYRVATTVFLAIPLLTSCAAGLSPNDVVNSGKLTRFQSKQAPIVVANCIARNADEDHSGASLSGVVGNFGGDPLDVVIRAGNNVVSTVKVRRIENKGSEVNLYIGQVASMLFSSSTPANLTRGCL